MTTDISTDAVIRFALNKHVLKFGDFTLKSGRQSPYFFNLGHIDDGASLTERTPLGRSADAEEVAKLALFLASDESSYSTGSEFVIDGGWTAMS